MSVDSRTHARTRPHGLRPYRDATSREAAYRQAKRLGRQQITRLPFCRKGDWVRIGGELSRDRDDLSGRLLQVRNVTCVAGESDAVARWTVHFTIGRSLPAERVLRFATAEEIAAAETRGW